MDADRDTLATALYVRTDDLLKSAPQRPVVGIPLRIADAEVIAPAVIKALAGYTREARWLRYADATTTRPTRPPLTPRLRPLMPLESIK